MTQRFFIYSADIADGLPIRKANREAHLAFLKAEGDVRVLTAGPWLNASGEMAGSLLIVEARCEADVEAWGQTDPYVKAGLRGDYMIKPFIWAIGAPQN